MTRFSEWTFVKLAAVFAVCGVFISLVSCDEGSGVKSRRAASDSAPAASADMVNEAAAGFSEFKNKSDAPVRYAYFQAREKEATRRIIYEAEINLVVKNMAETETQISKLLKQFDGYVGESNVDRRQGEHLTGHWKVRVPATQFDSFLEGVSKLGVAESRKQTAQDVTAEFVDLEAQIVNKKRLEERIVALLKDTSGKIKDVIEVEHELARVRGEIEQMEGRLRYLANRTDLTTISIFAREEENYVPPAAPTFANRITQAWDSSLGSLRSFGEQLLLAVVAAFPWVVAFSVVLVPASWFARKRIAMSIKQAGAKQPPGANAVD